jgi:TetR/AcrR family transcriptional regulator of autoinduction and epiphytic fitness
MPRAGSPITAPPPADGRAARSQRTRRLIAQAMLSLIQEGVLRPTAPRVAERAGVSLRSVFHHFRDMEALYAIAAEIQTEHVMAMLKPVDTGLPLPERIERFVAARSGVLEALAPVRRAVLLDEPFSAVIAARLAEARARFAEEVERVFAAELRMLPASERRDRLCALAAASEWPLWDSLRRHQGLSLPAARRVLRLMLAGIVAGWSPHIDSNGSRTRKERAHAVHQAAR